METPFIVHDILVMQISEDLTGKIHIDFGTKKPIDQKSKERIGKMLERYIKAEFIGTPPGFDADEALN